MTSSSPKSSSSEPASSRSPPPKKPESTESSDTFDSEDNPPTAFEGLGAPTVTCPSIRKSHCFFYEWQAFSTLFLSSQIDKPCHFTFVSERTYQHHIAHEHSDHQFDWLNSWYSLEDFKDSRGRLPRYGPKKEVGVNVVDRRARDNPVRMSNELRALYKELDGTSVKKDRWEEKPEGQLFRARK